MTKEKVPYEKKSFQYAQEKNYSNFTEAMLKIQQKYDKQIKISE